MLFATAALCLLVAAPVPANGGAADGGATVAKKCKKKKRKCKKRPPVPVSAPVNPTPIAPAIPQPNCAGEDAFEPSDTFAQATPLAITLITQTTTAFRCPSNGDFWVVSIPAGEYNGVFVDPDSTLDASLYIYNASGTLMPGYPKDMMGAGGVEGGSYDNIGQPATTYFIQVTSATAASTGSYTIVAYIT